MYASLQPGDRIAGKYRILRTLGSGGMGAVFLAQHERLERPVAIKVLHRHLGESQSAIARFEREVKVMALVQHRHVVHALDADVLEDGSLYLVMEHLEGRDLRAERKLRCSIPYAEAVAYVVQACEGVAAVHDVGIIHRDLKPHNLFLTNLTAARCVKVLDFGVAKLLVGAEMTLTATDVTVGTPLYMSPEQLCSPNDISPRSDVWALGVVLYELIAGVSPFAAETPGAVVAAVTLEDPIPLHEMVAEVPEGLSQVVAGALTKSSALRIGSARQFAEKLAPFGMPTDAIYVASSIPSKRPLLALERESARPELSAQIRGEVESFDVTVRPGAHPESLDELRQLPNLARLSIPLTNPASPAARQAAVLVSAATGPLVINVDLPSASLPNILPSSAAASAVAFAASSNAQKKAAVQFWRRPLALLALFLLGGLGVAFAMRLRTSRALPATNAPTMDHDGDDTKRALVASAGHSGSLPPSNADVAQQPIVLAEPNHVQSQKSAPADRRGGAPKLRAPLRTAPGGPVRDEPPARAPLASDGKPLHL